MAFIFLILYGFWAAVSWYMPVMICGFSYSELISILQDKDLDLLTKFSNMVGATSGDSAHQFASKYLFLSIGIVIVIFLVITIVDIVLTKRLNKSKCEKEKTNNNNNSNTFTIKKIK